MIYEIASALEYGSSTRSGSLLTKTERIDRFVEELGVPRLPWALRQTVLRILSISALVGTLCDSHPREETGLWGDLSGYERSV